MKDAKIARLQTKSISKLHCLKIAKLGHEYYSLKSFMNLPNLLTLSRIPLMLVVIGLLYPLPEESWPWVRTIALLVFLFAALTDWLDGSGNAEDCSGNRSPDPVLCRCPGPRA